MQWCVDTLPVASNSGHPTTANSFQTLTFAILYIKYGKRIIPFRRLSMTRSHVDVAIVGAGVTGTALVYVLAKYSTVRSVALIEKESGPALVNSNPINNAQTSHDGGTETNYTLPHALEVKEAAVALRRYVTGRNTPGLYALTHRMALAVGAREVEILQRRFELFRLDYPDLRLVGPEELRVLEPKVMEGRSPSEPVLALVSSEGYAINYQRLAECFLEDAATLNPGVQHFFDTRVNRVRRNSDGYELETDAGTIVAKTVVFASGAFSLWFAHQLDYGLQYAILAVGGNFYSAGPLLNGKVYRVQQENLPFAEVHGDPNVLDKSDTRFGPTTKPLFLMERHRLETFVPYATLGLFSWRGFTTMVRVLSRKGLFGYILENYLYDLPVLGKHLFLRKIRKIVPTLKAEDLQWFQNAGGIRPQIVNLATGELEMGEKTLVGDNVIFETTPSPGASVCLRNAVRVAEQVVAFLGDEYALDMNRVTDELGLRSART